MGSDSDGGSEPTERYGSLAATAGSMRSPSVATALKNKTVRLFPNMTNYSIQ
jgi:hypothetical protein